jgi:hypothetical protein
MASCASNFIGAIKIWLIEIYFDAILGYNW